MKIYIALLRGINVSGQKKVPMGELRSILTSVGFDNVNTYIQSGNVVFESKENNTAFLEALISDKIKVAFGFEVPVLVKNRTEFKSIFKSNPFANVEAIARKQVYFVLLKNTPEKELVKLLSTEVYTNEDFKITANCVYLHCKTGYGKAKLNNNLVERKLKVEATARNYATMVKLLEMSA